MEPLCDDETKHNKKQKGGKAEEEEEVGVLHKRHPFRNEVNIFIYLFI